MVKRRNEFPSNGELVVGTVAEINPNSIFVKLEEYDKEGMIHISEVASKWVRDIRNWASEDEKVVCKVKGVRKKKDQIDLSLKDVSEKERNKRMQSWKRDQRGDEFLEVIAENENKSKDEIYEEIGFSLQENFKDMLEPFEIAVKMGTDELEKRGMKEGWAQKIKEVAEEKIKVKKEGVKKRFNIQSWEEDGIEIIKGALSCIEDEIDVKFKYISAPEYEVSTMAKDPKEGEEDLEKSIDMVRERLKDKKAEITSTLE